MKTKKERKRNKKTKGGGLQQDEVKKRKIDKVENKEVCIKSEPGQDAEILDKKENIKKENLDDSKESGKNGSEIKLEETEIKLEEIEIKLEETETATKKMTSVYVGNLPYDTNEKQLGEYLTTNGISYQSCHIAKKGSKSRGFGFFECVNDEDIEKCLALKNPTIQENLLRFEIRSHEFNPKVMGSQKPKSLVIVSSYIPPDTSVKKVRRLLNQQDIKFIEAKITDKRVYVTLKWNEWEKLCRNENPFDDLYLNFEIEKDMSPVTGKVEFEPSKVLFVKNIPNNVKDTELRETALGPLRIRRKTFKMVNRCIAFLEYKSIKDATKALKKLNGSKLRSCTLVVQYSQLRRVDKEKEETSKQEFYSEQPTRFIEIHLLPKSIDEERLSDVFTTASDVTIQATGPKFNSGILEFPSADHAVEARRRLVGRTVDGVELRMKYINKPKQQKQGKIQAVVTRTKIV